MVLTNLETRSNLLLNTSITIKLTKETNQKDVLGLDFKCIASYLKVNVQF